MHKRISLIAVLFVCILAAALPVLPAYAQGTPTSFDAVEIELWPEYDQPSMLVIVHLSLPASASLPANVTYSIPVDSLVNAVAIQQPNGQLVNAAYDVQVSGVWQTLSFTATLPDIQIEYYDPGLQKDGDQRSYTYTWHGDSNVQAMIIQVQQPFDASQMNIAPGPVSSSGGALGLTYFRKDIGTVAVGQSFDLKIEYSKPSDTLTVEKQTVEASGPLSATTNSGSGWVTPLAWGLGFLGLALIGGGIYWYWRTGQQPKNASARRRARGPRSKRIEDTQEGAADADGAYCHQCGKRAGPGDRFCRSCGARLRIE